MMRRAVQVAVLFATIFVAMPARAGDIAFPAGSKFGMAPLAGFITSGNGHGFEDAKNKAAILIVEMPVQSYPEIEKAMTVDALKKQGVAVAFRENVKLKDGKGVLIAGRQVIDGVTLRKWLLLGTSADGAALVTALVPDSAKDVYSDAAMRTMLTSLEYRPTIPPDEILSLLPYKLADLGGMRPFRVEGPIVFLTEGPKDTSDANEQPLLIVSAAPGGPAEQPQRENFARTLFSGVPGFSEMRVVSSDIIRLGGAQTYQLMAEAKDAKTDTNMKFVQWIRFGNGAYIRMVGVSRTENWPDAFTRFRAVRDGLGPKE
ncbi:MAG: hypothetical protein ACXWLD_04830 [Rhizomicrobium sp.]